MSNDKTDTIRAIEDATMGPLSFGRLLRLLRTTEKASQTSWAEKLGISRSHMCELEHGQYPVKVGRAAQWARILGYDEKDFVRYVLQDLVAQDGLSHTVLVR